MKINTLISLTNTKLAGETLTYAQLRPLFDEVIIDINADLNACFPLFSTYAPDYNNLEAEYDCFPDMYLASVVATGAAYKFYTIDEEGIAVAQSFGADYQKALFHMVRDYSSSVPLVFQNTGKQGYITATNNGEWLYAASDPLSITRTNESGITIGINPDIRIQQGPQGATGAQGEKGDTGNYYRIEAQGSKIQAVLYDSTTGQPMDAPIILLGDLNDITRTSIHGELLDNLSVGVVNTTESTAKVTLTKSGDTYLLNFDVPKGINGKTPQKGIDYFTDADISEIKTYADNKDADILETAKDYANTADSRTLTNAKTYVDEALTNKVDKLDGYGLATGTFYTPLGTAKTWKRISINRTDGVYPDSFIIPKYTSDLENDSGYATETYVNNAIEEVEAIAKGRATGYVFDTIDDMNTWLADDTNTAKLVLGDNLYIRATDVPDYWWDGSTAQQLETQKVDLSEYATKTEVEDEATARTNKDTELEGKITSLTPKYIKEVIGLYTLENNTHCDCAFSDNDGVGSFEVGLVNISDVNGPFESSIYLAPCSAETIIFNDSTGITSYFGDDCNENGVFTPQANTHYEISFKRVGTDSDNNPIIIARVGAWQ